MDEKRISVLLDKFYQCIDHNLSCTLYEVPIPEKTFSSGLQACDQLYKPSDLCIEFWCYQAKACFIKYQGDKQAYDRFCQLAEIAAEFLPSPKDEKHSTAPDNKKRWVYHLVDFLRSEPESNIKKHVYGKTDDLNEEMGDSIFTVNQEMLTLYNWAKDSTQKKVLVSSSDIKNLFNASARVLEKMYKPLEGQSPKTVSGNKAGENKEREAKNEGNTYVIAEHISLGDKAQHANRDIITTIPKPVKKWEKLVIILTALAAIATILIFLFGDRVWIRLGTHGWNLLKRQDETRSLSMSPAISIDLQLDKIVIRNDGQHTIINVKAHLIAYEVQRDPLKILNRTVPTGYLPVAAILTSAQKVELTAKQIVFGNMESIPHGKTEVVRAVVFEYFRQADNKRFIRVEPFFASTIDSKWVLFPLYSDGRCAVAGDPTFILNLVQEIDKTENIFFRASN